MRIASGHMFNFPSMLKMALKQHLQCHKRQQLEDYCMLIRKHGVNKCKMELFVIMQRDSVVSTRDSTDINWRILLTGLRKYSLY